MHWQWLLTRHCLPPGPTRGSGTVLAMLLSALCCGARLWPQRTGFVRAEALVLYSAASS